MRRVAIVQARMGSSRLPGKVLADVGGEPIVVRIVNRLRKCQTLDDICIATSTLPADDLIADVAKEHDIRCVRGSEGDVLSRYALAVYETDADVVVRVTADCPLLSPEVVDHVVRQLGGRWDMASNAVERSYPRGLDVEVLWADVIHRLDRMAATPQAREHVTWAAYKDDLVDLFRVRAVKDREDHSALNWCVDTSADLARVRRLVALYGDIGWRELVEKELAEAA